MGSTAGPDDVEKILDHTESRTLDSSVVQPGSVKYKYARVIPEWRETIPGTEGHSCNDPGLYDP
jgi:hypothetical protein